MSRDLHRWCVAIASATLVSATPLAAQTTGAIVGRVVDAESGALLAQAEIVITELERSTLSGDDGRFLLAGVPAGFYTLSVELLSYRTLSIERVEVRAGRRTNLRLALSAAALEVAPLIVRAERIPLIEPDVSETHQVLLGRQLRELPTDATQQAIELTTGVSDGHFRGGRVGQETYVVDGLGLKNQLEASSQGFGLEYAPSSLQEIDVATGGFGAEYGSALSGVVKYITRRGDPERWSGEASLLSDHWAPSSVSRGFSELSLSAGGPLRLLGPRSTLFADLLLQGMLDADPRAKGLTCLDREQAEPELAELIDALTADPSTAHLYCPFSEDMIPHQQGDKLIGFLRLDVPVGQRANLMGSLLRNRFQRQLYTPEFKYNPDYQLGQRQTGTLGSLVFDWSKDAAGRAYHLTARAAALRIDRYLGVVDPQSLTERADIAGFGLSDFEFLGEEFVRRPVAEQQVTGTPVPGYSQPGGSSGSPFGPAAEGIFFTEGTPGIANWTRSDMLGGDLVGELLTATGHSFKAGVSTRFYSVENYERPFSYAVDSLVNFSSYDPGSLSGFAEARVSAGELFAAAIGFRIESFRSGLSLPADTADPQAPVIDGDWKFAAMPRVGFAGAFRNSAGETSFRFNFARLAQPPDFRFFADATIGDSLRTDIRRQGNPNLGFERGRSYELGIGHVLNGSIGLSVTAFRKELSNLVTGSLQVSSTAPAQFSTADKGTVQGFEISAYGRWTGIELRGGYSLQKATGLATGLIDDEVDPEARFEEFPLAHDRRHAIDLVVLGGHAAAWGGTGWGAALIGSVRSGLPLDPRAPTPTRLPWTALVGLRVTRELGGPALCGDCRIRLIFDGRNIIGRDNVIALRRDTGGLGPTPESVLQAANDIPATAQPIPRESNRYNPLIDLDGDGLITAAELQSARVAAALDRNDPSLFFGEPSSVRVGLEIAF